MQNHRTFWYIISNHPFLYKASIPTLSHWGFPKTELFLFVSSKSYMKFSSMLVSHTRGPEFDPRQYLWSASCSHKIHIKTINLISEPCPKSISFPKPYLMSRSAVIAQSPTAIHTRWNSKHRYPLYKVLWTIIHFATLPSQNSYFW